MKRGGGGMESAGLSAAMAKKLQARGFSAGVAKEKSLGFVRAEPPRAPSRPRVIVTREYAPDREGARESQETLAGREMSALSQGTAKAFAQHFLKVALSMHHLGLAVQVITWAHRIWQWSNVAAGDGSLEINAPIPLGPGVELDLSVHAGNDPDGSQPPLTVCFAPGGDSPIGVLTFGPFEVSPDAGHGQARAQDHSQAPAMATAQRHGRVIVITQDLSDALLVHGSEERVAQLHYWAENTLAPELEANPWLRQADTGLVVVYDPDTAAAVWVRLPDSQAPSWRVVIRPERAGPGAARIAVTSDDRWQELSGMALVVNEVLPLEQAGLAHQKMDAGEVFGRIVFVPSG